MSRYLPALLLIVLSVTSGCAQSPSRWRDQATVALAQIRAKGINEMFPIEYTSVISAVDDGDKFLHDDVDTADDYYRLAVAKSRMLERELAQFQERQAEVKRHRELAEEENKRIQDVKQKEKVGQPAFVPTAPRKSPPESAGDADKTLPLNHTVKRGETLPQIAAQPDVYNDYRLWPLLYRANRDQISDPKHIWPGQVLRIPRNASREELAEARRYSLSKPIR